MSKVIIFSRFFPATHPRKKEETFFVEKIWESIYLSVAGWEGFGPLVNSGNGFDIGMHGKYEPKHHTIRSGRRWKVGDCFSPRTWSGRPYASKQIIIGPDIEIKSIQDIRIEVDGDYLCVLIDEYPFYEENSNFVMQAEAFETLARNDGLSVVDFRAWFKIHNKNSGNIFQGQILSWRDDIQY